MEVKTSEGLNHQDWYSFDDPSYITRLKKIRVQRGEKTREMENGEGSISFGFQFLFSNGLVRYSMSRDGISRLSSHAASLGEPSGVRARFDSLTLACGDVSDAPVFSTCNLRTASNARSIANRIKTLSLLYLYVSSS